MFSDIGHRYDELGTEISLLVEQGALFCPPRCRFDDRTNKSFESTSLHPRESAEHAITIHIIYDDCYVLLGRDGHNTADLARR